MLSCEILLCLSCVFLCYDICYDVRLFVSLSVCLFVSLSPEMLRPPSPVSHMFSPVRNSPPPGEIYASVTRGVHERATLVIHCSITGKGLGLHDICHREAFKKNNNGSRIMSLNLQRV